MSNILNPKPRFGYNPTTGAIYDYVAQRDVEVTTVPYTAPDGTWNLALIKAAILAGDNIEGAHITIAVPTPATMDAAKRRNAPAPTPAPTPGTVHAPGSPPVAPVATPPGGAAAAVTAVQLKALNLTPLQAAAMGLTHEELATKGLTAAQVKGLDLTPARAAALKLSPDQVKVLVS